MVTCRNCFKVLVVVDKGGRLNLFLYGLNILNFEFGNLSRNFLGFHYEDRVLCTAINIKYRIFKAIIHITFLNLAGLNSLIGYLYRSFVTSSVTARPPRVQ